MNKAGTIAVVSIIIIFGLGVATANSQTPTSTPTPTPTPTPQPQWVPALFDDGSDCPDIDSADLDLELTNTITGTIRLRMHGVTAASIVFNQESCYAKSDLSEIAEPYRIFRSMADWDMPGIYGIRFAVDDVVIGGGEIHFPSGLNNVPVWETITDFETRESQILCFYYGGGADDDRIDIDNDCDVVMRASSAPRQLDINGTINFLIGIWGQTINHEVVDVTISDISWSLIGEAVSGCFLSYDKKWTFDLTNSLGPWADNGFTLTSEQFYTPYNSMIKPIIFTGSLTTTLTLTETRQLVSSDYDQGIWNPLFGTFAKIDPGVTAGIKLTMVDGQTETVMFTPGGDWEWKSVLMLGQMLSAEIFVSGMGEAVFDDIKIIFHAECPDECETHRWHFNSPYVVGDWAAMNWDRHGLIGANAPGSLWHYGNGSDTATLDLTELQTQWATTKPFVSAQAAITSTWRSDYDTSYSQLEIGFTDGTYTTTQTVYGPSLFWERAVLTANPGRFVSSVSIRAWGPGVYHDDIVVRLCTGHDDPPGGTGTPGPTLYPTGTPGPPVGTPTPPPTPDPGDDGFPSPPGGDFGTCYDCNLPANYLSFGQWIRWLQCEIRNLFYCSLYIWLLRVGNWVAGVFRAMFAWIEWVGGVAQNGVNWLGSQIIGVVRSLVSPAGWVVAFLAAMVGVGRAIVESAIGNVLLFVRLFGGFVSALKAAFGVDPAVLSLNGEGVAEESQLMVPGANNSKILWLFMISLAAIDSLLTTYPALQIVFVIAMVSVSFGVIVWTLWFWSELLQY